jgi:hypothetical protein
VAHLECADSTINYQIFELNFPNLYDCKVTADVLGKSGNDKLAEIKNGHHTERVELSN